MLVARGDPKAYAGGRLVTAEEICPWAFVDVLSGPDYHDDGEIDGTP
jgi:hypothetical protein